MTAEEKKQLKKKLPAKWSVAIAKETKLSQSYVRRVMAGLASHVAIEKAAILLATKHTNELKEVESLKKKLL